MSQDSKKHENCLKKSNILVYQQPSGKRVERNTNDCGRTIKIPICTPHPKPIHVCTGAELRKMCSPKICPCNAQPKSRFGLLKLLGFGLKSAIAVAAVYITYDMGIWGTTDDSQAFYSNACTIFGHPQPKKNTKWDPPSCEIESDFFNNYQYKPYEYCEQPPLRVEDIRMKIKQYWNKGVIFIFHGIAELPNKLMGRTDETVHHQQTILQNDESKSVPHSQLSKGECEENPSTNK
ncbi:hypothetical protein ABEB36_007435 [Hypothenemus hampei]|uniref:MICOS complex subunit MIC13 n=1 Tax=Hypothenemus hampei TaxID=57062 RepID=A0ABD1EU20_HYPHA